MTLLYSIFKLVRLPNLIIVILTQWFLHHYILLPNFEKANVEYQMSEQHFWLLVIITVLVTAGGYIMNDILDYRLDLINKPQKVIVNKALSQSLSYWLYFGSVLLGFVLSLYVAFRTGNLHLLGLFPLAVVGLYLYSTILKKSFLLGNLLVSFYCSGVAGIIWLAEYPSLQQLALIDPEVHSYIQFVFGVYMLLAFLSTLFREIIKDIEDLNGDVTYNSKSIPIVWGIQKAKRTSFIIGMALLLTMIFALYNLTLVDYPFKISFVILTMISPMILALTWLLRAQSKKQYHRLSQLTKFLMVSGILLLLIISM